ncbi:MAG: sulfatase-like hydrolase/transferase [bacterium]|nr:sulfatase-like hydrolase/transferase [bacterium]
MKRIAAIALLIVAAILVATVIFQRPSSELVSLTLERSKRSVLLVTLDTTRVDRLEPYGSEDVSTPTLQRLADQGIVFEHAVAVAPITLVSHTSILTGLYPFEHGVRNNGIQYVPDDVTTLAERLQGEGYRTAAFVSAAVLDRRYGLNQGFEVYDDDLSTGRDRRPRSVADRPAEAVVDAAAAWLESLEDDERYFLWVHFYDPHAAYSPPPPYRDDYRERLYDGEIAYADAQLGRLLEHPRFTTDEPIVTVIADHGESLGEHGEQTHAILAYDSTLHVPWILRLPQGQPAGMRVPQTVGHVDLMPTVLSLLGLEPEEKISGRDLLPVLEGRFNADSPTDIPAYYSETYLPFYTYGWSKLRSIRRGGWKMIDAPTPELYYLRKDPRELSNVHERQPGQAHDLARDLEELLAKVEDPELEASLAIDTEAAEKLRSLGYLATGSGTRGADAERPDPKDVIDLHVGLEQARTLLQDRLFEQAGQRLRSVLRRDPDNLAALIDLATALEGQGEVDEAVKMVERGLELDPEYHRLYLILARLEMERGELEKALELIELAGLKDPKNPEVTVHRATLLSRLGRRDEAKTALGAALAGSPEHAWLNLSYARLVEMREGKLEEAEARLRLALERDPFLAGGWSLLGQLLERDGRHEGAVESFRAGLERHTDDPELHAALGHLLARLGQRAEAEQHLRESLRLGRRFRADLHVSLGGLLAESGRFEDARREYDKVLAVEPKHPGARNNAAIALYRAGRAADAQAELQKLVAEFPNMPDAHNNLAAIAIDQRQWKAVEFHSRRTIELDPDLVQAWNNLAVALEEQGDRPGARGAYERALAIDAAYWQARFNLGILLRRAGDHRAAAASFEEVLGTVPQQPDSHLELGELYAGPLADPRRARTHFNAFLRYAPRHPRAADVKQQIAALPVVN